MIDENEESGNYEYSDIEFDYILSFLGAGEETDNSLNSHKVFCGILEFAIAHKDWKDFSAEEKTEFFLFEKRRETYTKFQNESDILVDYIFKK